MSQLTYFFLCSVTASCITAYILLDKVGWKTSGIKFSAMLVLHAILLGFISIYSYPYSKMIAIVIDSAVLSMLLMHHRKKQLVENISFGILIALCEFVTYPLSLFLQQTLSNFLASNTQINAIILAVSQLIILYLYRLYKHLRPGEREATATFVSVFQVFVLPVFTITNLLFMMLFSAYYMLPWMLVLMFMNIVFVISLNVYLFYLFDKMEENHRLKQKAVLLEEMSKIQYSYYHHLEEKYQNSRQVIHDVKRHLQVLENNEMPKESMHTYVQDMKEMLSRYSQQIYSTHPIVNIILHEKFEEAEANNITVDCRIAPIDFTFLREIDVTVIFANLLDNAIDACQEVQEAPYVFLQIDRIHDFLVIVLRNSCIKKADTSKSSKAGHEGLGLQNVRKTLEQYGGNMQVESLDHEFTVHLYIPML